MVFADSIAKWRVGKTGLFKQFLALGITSWSDDRRLLPQSALLISEL